MAPLLSKVTKFLSSPQGKKLTQQATKKAQTMAKDPATRKKVDAAVSGVRKRFGGSGGSTPGGSTPGGTGSTPR